jgi:hypothetical protein
MNRERLRRLETLVRRLAAALGRKSPPPGKPLKTIHDVIDLLNEQVEAVRNDPLAGALEKARTVAYLSSVASRVMASAQLADRVKLLEAILREREGRKQVP